jgi:hypothetical protein
MASIYIQSGIAPGVTGPGDLGYFGLNSNDDAWKRLDVHYAKLKKGIHSNPAIQNFYNQRGDGFIHRAIVIECDEYYLNTLEKAYIARGNTNQKFNPEGWNQTAGGEGAKANLIPYSFIKNGVVHQGNNLLQFLKIVGQAEPAGFVELLDGRRKEYDGYTRYP